MEYGTFRYSHVAVRPVKLEGRPDIAGIRDRRPTEERPVIRADDIVWPYIARPPRYRPGGKRETTRAKRLIPESDEAAEKKQNSSVAA